MEKFWALLGKFFCGFVKTALLSVQKNLLRKILSEKYMYVFFIGFGKWAKELSVSIKKNEKHLPVLSKLHSRCPFCINFGPWAVGLRSSTTNFSPGLSKLTSTCPFDQFEIKKNSFGKLLIFFITFDNDWKMFGPLRKLFGGIIKFAFHVSTYLNFVEEKMEKLNFFLPFW